MADTVVLKNGRSIEGIIEKDNTGQIVLNIGPGKIKIQNQDIAQINKYTEAEQDRLRKEWSYKYYLHPGFIPDRLESLAIDLQDLVSSRYQAVNGQLKKTDKEYQISRIESELKKLKSDLVDVSSKIASTDSEKDIEDYNELIKKANVLSSQEKLNKIEKEDLQKEITSLDKDISRYINKLKIFGQQFARFISDKPENLSGEEQDFLDAVDRHLNRMNRDFTGYAVDYRIDGGSLVVKASINDIIDIDLVVDTGAGLVVISENVAEELNLDFDEQNSMNVTLANGQKVKAYRVILDKVAVGDAEVKNVEAAILEERTPQTTDGLLGMSFLNNFMVKLHAKDKELILEKFNPGRD